MLRIISFFLLASIIVKTQNWLPLEIGNTWQFIKSDSWSGPPAHTNYFLHTIAVINDTIINGIHYFKILNSDGNKINWVRYSPTENRIYEWKNNSEIIIMDFSKNIGEYFYRGGRPCEVIGGTVNLFSQIYTYEGCDCNFSVQPSVNYVYDYYIENLGWYKFTNNFSHWPDYRRQNSNLTSMILFDSVGISNYSSDVHIPVIS